MIIGQRFKMEFIMESLLVRYVENVDTRKKEGNLYHLLAPKYHFNRVRYCMQADHNKQTKKAPSSPT